MNRYRTFSYAMLFGIIVSFAGIVLAQSTPKVLVVNGRTLGVLVRQIDGRSYVDVEALAEITNGAVTLEANRILLTIPGSSSAPAANVSSASAAPAPGFSREFAGTAIAALAEMREWRGAVGTMITYGLAVSAGWAQDYHDRVQASLTQASVAALTDADRQALQLLRNEFDRLAAWSSDVMAARQALNAAKTVDPNALQNDPVLTKITTCNRFLNSMIVSGVFADDPSCH